MWISRAEINSGERTLWRVAERVPRSRTFLVISPRAHAISKQKFVSAGAETSAPATCAPQNKKFVAQLRRPLRAR
jgi:hypothetical protein